MRILAIETSCDETAIATVKARGGLRRPYFEILSNIVSSQVAVHREYGGVVPSLAKREHLKNLPIVLARALRRAGGGEDIDAICVTVGPGLEPALWAGINFAKELKKKWRVSLVGVNHLEGHLYSFLLSQKAIGIKNKKFSPKASPRLRMASDGQASLAEKIKNFFPAVALVVSGGHTILMLMESLVKYKKLGETQDDAAGEAYDKVARMLGLPYPGGAEIEKLARRGKKTAIYFPRPMMRANNFNFSFSGLKTSVLYYLRDHQYAKKQNVAASFQTAVIDVLVTKTMRAANEYGAKSIFLSGGVAANKALRKELQKSAHKQDINFLVADVKYNTDNAAMIAVAGYINILRGKNCALRAQGNLNIR